MPSIMRELGIFHILILVTLYPCYLRTPVELGLEGGDQGQIVGIVNLIEGSRAAMSD